MHAGPFANIAIGQSSIIADRVGLKLSEYHVTESWLCRRHRFREILEPEVPLQRLKPDASVIVATVRALKCYGGAPVPVPGKPLPEEYA